MEMIMYVEMLRRGIEWDAEAAFNNPPEPTEYQTKWDVVSETFDNYFDKFLHITNGFDTPEVIEQRLNLLENLKEIAIRITGLQHSIREDLDKLVESRKFIYAKELTVGEDQSFKI
jgi:hypothetical protein